MLSAMPGGDVALFIDWDNLQLPANASKGALLKELACKHGRVVVARAYYDWAADENSKKIVGELCDAGIEPVYVSCRRADGAPEKNAVDVKMSLDCLEVGFLYPGIETFVLVTCDQDFVHVAQALRRRGRRVVVAGCEGCLSRRLAAVADEVVGYGAREPDVVLPAVEKAPCLYAIATVDKAMRLVLTDLKAKGGKGYPQAIGGFKALLVAKLPFFDEKAYGASKFGEFVKAREAAGALRVVRKGTADYVELPN